MLYCTLVLFALSEMEMLHIVKTRQCLVPDAAARAGPASVLSRRLEAGPRALTGLGLISGLCISAAQSHTHTPQGHHSININNADTRGVSLRGLHCPPAAAHRSRLPDVQVVSTVHMSPQALTPVTQDRPQTRRRPPRPPPQRPGAQAEAALGREEHEGGDAG